MRRKLLFLGLLFWFSVRAAAEAPQPLPPSTKRIHVAILIDKLDEFWTHFVRIAHDAADQLGMRISVFHGQESHLDMVRKAEELVTAPMKPDAIMFKSFKGNGRQIMAVLTRHKVQAFSVNAPIVLPPQPHFDSPYLLGELLPDDEQAGYILVKSLRADVLKRGLSKVHLVAINGDQADSPAQLRERGLRRAAADFKDVILLQVISDAWTAPHAAHQFAVLRKRYPSINAVWAGNDTIALRVAEHARSLGYRLGQDLAVGGIDVSPEGLEAIKRGDLVTSVGGHILDGGRALVILHDYFKTGKLTQKSWLTPMEAVTRNEVEAYLKILNPKVRVPIDFLRYSRQTQPGLPYDFSFPKP